MSVLTQQDQDYIKNVRDASSNIIQQANMGQILNTSWNNCFGGGARLGEPSFTGDEGLVKADIEAAKDVLAQLEAWLVADSRRVALEKVFNPAYHRA